MSVDTNCYNVFAMSRRIETGPRRGHPNELHTSARQQLGFDRVPQEQGDVDGLLEFVEQQYESPGVAAHFETLLEVEGFLSGLEDAGILPIVETANPFDPELEEELNQRWWKEHPEAAEEFHRNFEKRDEVLKLLCVGALLGGSFLREVPIPPIEMNP